jgi:hypothetical protein
MTKYQAPSKLSNTEAAAWTSSVVNRNHILDMESDALKFDETRSWAQRACWGSHVSNIWSMLFVSSITNSESQVFGIFLRTLTVFGCT